MFLKWLRQQPHDKGGDTPAVAVSGYYERGAAITGWTAYFQKPFDIEQFVRAVADILHIRM